jgi:glycosyltransferase involved in cell wall biosynthesis
LIPLCYHYDNYQVGKSVCDFYLSNIKKIEKSVVDEVPVYQTTEIVRSWLQIFDKLYVYKINKYMKPIRPKKPIFCFVADGGFQPWSGSSLDKTGVGGSETYIIEMANHIQKTGLYQVYVFCRCEGEGEKWQGVHYVPLANYYTFINDMCIKYCIISRYSEYVSLSIKGYVENIYFVCHDLTPNCNIISLDPKVKGVFCMSEWHKQYFLNIYPSLENITHVFYNGVDTSPFYSNVVQKVPFRFIYTSFPNRGLLNLLKMWPLILAKEPKATLHIYCDLNGDWVNNRYPEIMIKIHEILSKLKNITVNGWVDKKTLNNAWKIADIWFYPCTFMETFCITALECAISKTLAITNDLGALQNTVGDRGIMIPGNPFSQEWQDNALETIYRVLECKQKKIRCSYLEMIEDKVERNYQWALQYSWEKQAKRFLQTYVEPIQLEHVKTVSTFL